MPVSSSTSAAVSLRFSVSAGYSRSTRSLRISAVRITPYAAAARHTTTMSPSTAPATASHQLARCRPMSERGRSPAGCVVTSADRREVAIGGWRYPQSGVWEPPRGPVNLRMPVLRYVRRMTDLASPARVGSLLRDWRRRRRLSQLDLALEAGVSARHVSFVETGRSRPSAEMVLHLAEQLDVPLRERNRLLLAAGHAPVYEQHDLQDPEMAPVRDTIQRPLAAHEPFPALVVDRHWEMLAANAALGVLLEGVAPELLEPPVNVLRVGL